MNEEISVRLGQIETHLAHLEHQVEQMNGVIMAQDKLLENMRADRSRPSGPSCLPYE